MSSRSRLFAILGLVVASAACVRLGFWQLSRLHQRRAANQAALAARAEPPLRLDRPAGRAPESLAERWVTVRGTYDTAHEIVLRGQAFQGTPGIYLVTPLRFAGSDTAVLVNRGFVPAPDAVRPRTGDLLEPGQVEVSGLAQTMGDGGGKPLRLEGRTTWARLDLAALRSALPYPILPVVIRQAPDSGLPRRPRRLPPPEVDDGPHLNYAVQWFLFAAMALAFAGVVVAKGGAGPRAP